MQATPRSLGYYNHHPGDRDSPKKFAGDISFVYLLSHEKRLEPRDAPFEAVVLRRERRERRREDGRGAAVRDVLEAVGVVVDERRERLLDALGHKADVATRGEVPRRELVPFVGERVRAEAPVAERAEARGAIQHRQVALEARVGRVDVRAGAHDRPPDHDRPSDEGVALHVQRAAHVDVPGRVHGRVRVHVKAVLGLERAAVARDDERAPTRVEGPDQHDVGGDELQARGAAAV